MSFFQSLEQYVATIADGKVAEVALSHRGLDDAGCLALATALASPKCAATVVDMQSNNVTSVGVIAVAEALKANTTLVELNLEHNAIDDAGAQALITLMETNATLKAVLLANNNVSAALVDNLSFTVSLNTQPGQIKAIIPRLRDNDPEVTLVDITGLTGTSFALLRNVLAKNTCVRTLICANSGVGDVGCSIMAEIAEATSSIEHLDLSANAITLHGTRALVAGLAKNASIQRLVLRANKIGDEAARALIEVLRANDVIVEIDMSDNAVTQQALDPVSHALELNRQPIELKRAYYAAQANDPTCTAIEFPWIANMKSCARFLAPVLKANLEVTVVNFSNARFGDAGAEAMATVLKVNTTITSLHMANDEITSTGGSAVAMALASNDTLTELNLANNMLCEIAAGEFAHTLLTNRALTFLNIELNQIPSKAMDEVSGLVIVNNQPRGLKKLLPALEANSDTITVVDFSQYDGERYHTDESARVLCEALMSNTHVTSVDMSFNSIGDPGAAHFARLLAVNQSIETLNLSQCAITDRGGALIADALYKNTTLLDLDLNSNILGEDTGAALLAALKDNHFVSSLSVERTRIGDATANDLRIACAVNTQPQSLKKVIPRLRECDESIIELDLSVYDGHRYFNDEAVAILCHELSGNQTVRTINLSQNQFGPEGAAAIGALLSQEGCTVTELDVSGNKIGAEGAKHLADAFERNDCLRVVDLRNCGIGNAGVLAVAKSLDSNDSIQMIHVTRTNDVTAKSMSELTRQLAINTQSLSLKAALPLILNNDPSMTTFAMIGDGEASGFGDTSANLLALALAKNHTVTSIDLRNNDITSEGAEFFADMLEDNKSITEFILSSNRIDDHGAQALIRIMAANDTMRNLDLSGNPVSEQLLGELDYVLRVNAAPVAMKRLLSQIASNDPAVTEADFTGGSSSSVFTDDSLHILCSLLVDNTHVARIQLANNDVTDEGAQLLADMLRANKTLTEITLDNNQITTEGANALFLALKVNHTLSVLTLSGNNISADALEQLESVLVINKQPLKEPKHAKDEFNKRPHVTEVDDHVQFRDADYMRDCENSIFDEAMKDFHAPPKQVAYRPEPAAVEAPPASSA